MATSTDLRAAIEEVQNQLPAEQLEAEGALYEADLATRVERRVGALPWWVVSAVVHAVIFLLATLLTVALPAAQTDEVVITSDVAKEKKPEFDPKKKRDIFRNPHEVKADTQVDNPLVVHEKVEDTTHDETENNMDSQTARGSEEAISDIPLGGTGVTGVVGVGGGGMAGVFGYRGGGGRKRAVARFGGSPATESAVLAALLWLKRHQEPDGHWDSKKYGAGSYGRGGDVGVTGLALLSFLGAGHTEKTGQFRDSVRRAQAWLVKQQDPKTGEIKDQKRTGRNAPPYNHSIAALALAEAYGMTRNPALRGPAQKAVECVNAWQNPYAGWRYKPKDGDSDPSVTGWMLMVIKSAKIAGLKVDLAAYQGGLKYLDLSTSKKGRKEGKTHYRFGSGGSYGRWQSMTSVSLFCRLLMGYRRTEDLLKKQADWLATDLPDWDKSKGNQSHSEYYWYYGTLAMFQMGGKHWKDWNGAMKKALLPNQQKGGVRDGSTDDVDGSWDPISVWGKCGGRVYTTAINALSLEVYYRYLPLYNK